MASDSGPQADAVHWAALDGLRGVAVVAVLLYHAFPQLAPNGFAGVDVFFVLSGFLITSLLVRERERYGRVSLPNFYMRRILRLYPALLLTVGLVLGLQAGRGELREAVPGAVAAVLYVSHVTIGLGIDSGFLSHTWTLSLEEHFYLFWPVVLLGLLAGRLRRSLAVIALLMLGLAILPGVLPGTVGAMYWRGLPMLVGSCIALVLPRLPPSTVWWGRSGLVSLAVLTVILMTPVAVPAVLMRGPFGIPTILSVVVIVGFVVARRSLGARFLSVVPLTWLGVRAYGLYLYHFPIVLSPVVSKLMSVLGVEMLWLGNMLLALGITVVCAGASYRWVEAPFLRLKDRFRIRESRDPAAAASIRN
ncbi:acyltransferase family protein [Ornithinimicrobium avium]|uniref:acyltransferase family protein n=1 Tax=Ornithinimicrobium avium TaxID=2283195 RepID=UPI0013B3D501|nr:acyltransferase [Ornithinimicrobium avium]